MCAAPNTKRNTNTEVNELYSTPIEALEAAWEEGLFDDFEVYIDVCNGLGDISDFLESKGKKVYRSDLIDYVGVEVDALADFLELETLFEDVECIVFNPPFKLTEKFIDKALSLCDNLIMFNRSTTLESASRSKKHKSGEWKLKEWWSFGYRVSCTEGVDRKPTNNAVWYSFFKYNQQYKGKPTIDWFIRD